MPIQSLPGFRGQAIGNNTCPTAVADAPKRNTQVVEQLEAQSRLIDNLESSIGKLSNRLDPVCRCTPTPAAPTTKDPEVFVPLAAMLKRHNERLCDVMTRVVIILETIEL